LERQHMEVGDDDGDVDDDCMVRRFRNDAQTGRMQTPSAAPPVRRRDHPPLHPSSPSSSPPLSARCQPRRRHYSFLQHFAVDDVLLRIFEFVECSSLVRTGATCHRFRELSTRSAEQRASRLHVDGRLLRNAMRMLRAQEQIDGVGPREGGFGPFVPIPMLGLPRRVRVSGAGDPEYDGIYFCTGCNGNGFLFTKPRWPGRGVAAAASTTTATGGDERDGGGGRGGRDAWWMNNDDGDDGARPAWGLDDWMEEMPIPGGGGMGLAIAPAAGDVVHRQDRRRGRRGADDDEADPDGDGVDEDGDEDDAPDGIGGGQRHDAADAPPAGDERNLQSRPLRCVRAKLLVTGDASPDECQYPSQTGILSRNGEPAWQHLTSTLDIAPPTVDLLDG